VIGPFINNNTDKPNSTHETFIGLMTGVFPGILRMGWGLVDVRDVAFSHVLALENPKAQGRHICANEGVSMKDVR
jgi:dihydroflavonol-4-reductase